MIEFNLKNPLSLSTMASLLNIIFFLALSFWIGSITFMSFIVAPTLFRELPKEVAGEFVSKIFPSYYMLGYICGSAAFLSLLFKGLLDKPFPWIRLLLIFIMLGCSLYAGTKVHPETHMVKTVMRSMEDSPEKDAKQKEFSQLHRLSVILNSIVLLAGIVVICITGYKIDF